MLSTHESISKENILRAAEKSKQFNERFDAIHERLWELCLKGVVQVDRYSKGGLYCHVLNMLTSNGYTRRLRTVLNKKDMYLVPCIHEGTADDENMKIKIIMDAVPEGPEWEGLQWPTEVYHEKGIPIPFEVIIHALQVTDYKDEDEEEDDEDCGSPLFCLRCRCYECICSKIH